MREILFRAKAINRDIGYHRTNYKNGYWVYGLVTKLYDERFDLPAEMTDINGVSGIEVDYKTIGQYTGLKDKNGKRIFEGDIFSRLDGAMDGIPRIVRWDEEHMEFKCPLVKKHWAFGKSDCSLWLMKYEDIEVIGNIHDNPELMK